MILHAVLKFEADIASFHRGKARINLFLVTT